tara:strand:+ start:1602 stop:2432 length:831 start_codon:yes stop_codon:yes gene_type:complete
MGVETDTDYYKIGDGSTVWTGLGYSSLPSTAIASTLVDAKGDLLAASADNTVARLAVGSNTYVLTADSSTATGLVWSAPTTGDVTGVTAGTNISGGGTSGTVTVNLAIDAAVDVGSDGSGVDISFHSGTAGDLMLWDASDKALEFTDAKITMGDNLIETPVIKDYAETVVASTSSGTSQTLVLTAGNVIEFSMTGNCTFTMPSGATLQAGSSLTLILTQDGTGSRTGAFTGVKWAGGTAPTLTTTATSGIDILTFYTFNGGASPVWYGFVAGAAMA